MKILKKRKLVVTCLTLIYLLTSMSMVNAKSGTSISELEAKVYEKIKKLDYPQQDSLKNISVNNEKVIVDEGKSFKLELLDENKKPITQGVKWFVTTVYPQGRVYEGGSNVEGISITLDSTGNVTANKKLTDYNKDTDVWAYYQDHLYYVTVIVRSKSEIEYDRQKQKVEEEADKILKELKVATMSDPEKALVIHDWLIGHMSYDIKKLDFNTETIHLTYQALVNKTGVCAHYARTYEYLLNRAGVRVKFNAGRVPGDMHAWTVVRLEDGWYYVDPTWDDSSVNQHRYFLMDPQTFERNHFDNYYPGMYEKTDKLGTKYLTYFYDRQNLVAHSNEEAVEIVKRKVYTNDSEIFKVTFLVDKKVDINSKIKEMQPLISKEDNSIQEIYLSSPISDFRGYNLVEVTIKRNKRIDSSKKEQKTISSIQVKDHEKRQILLEMDKSIDLVKENISIDGGKLISLEKQDKGYLLTLDYEISGHDSEVTVYVTTNQYRFIYLKGNKVKFQMKVQEKPNAKLIVVDDYNLKLTGLDESMEYRVNESNWKKVNAKELIFEKLNNNDVILIRRAKSISRWASPIQTFYVKKPNFPDSIKTKQGKLLGLSADMEYKLEGSSNWIPIKEKEVSGLKTGTYILRIKATNTSLASIEYKIYVEGGIENQEPQEAPKNSEVEKSKPSNQVQKIEPDTSNKKPESIPNKPDISKKPEVNQSNKNQKSNSSVVPNKPNVTPKKPSVTVSKPSIKHTSTPAPKKPQRSYYKPRSRKVTRRSRRVLRVRNRRVRNRRVRSTRTRSRRVTRVRSRRVQRIRRTRRVRR